MTTQLTELVDDRIAYLISNRYETRRVTHTDVFPAEVDGKPVMEWIIDRTLMRPRDIIAFVNEAIAQAVGSSRITVKMLREAEGQYSRGRLRSLADEWAADFPNLLRFTDILKGRSANFRITDITETECEEICLAVATDESPADFLRSSAIAVIEGNRSATGFRNELVEVFYRIGLLGLKLESFEGFMWASRGRRSISSAEINDATRIAVNPPFWRTLGIRPT